MVPPNIELGRLQGLCGEETDSGLEYSAEEDSKAGATSVDGDICSYPANVSDQNGFAQQQGEASDWQQAYDHTYGCLYYYCESTQVRHAVCLLQLAFDDLRFSVRQHNTSQVRGTKGCCNFCTIGICLAKPAHHTGGPSITTYCCGANAAFRCCLHDSMP